MNLAEQRQKAEKFRELHSGTFVLPNAWDSISARIFKACGFPAIGTTSAGIAISHGYADRAMSKDIAVAAIKQIVNSVDLPVTADIEAGYGEIASEVVDFVKQVVLAGAVGINLEDSTMIPERPLYDISEQQSKIAAIREMAESIGIPLFINARIDIYWLNLGEPSTQLQETIKRAKAYQEAGADCVFVPNLNKFEMIQLLRSEITCSLNLLAGPELPPIAQLAEVGVQRISTGSGPFRAAISHLQQVGHEIFNHNMFNKMSNNVPTYQEFAELMEEN